MVWDNVNATLRYLTFTCYIILILIQFNERGQSIITYTDVITHIVMSYEPNQVNNVFSL